MKPENALIVGCGYSGERLAARLRHSGAEVTAVLRSADRAHRLEAMGVRVLRQNLDEPPSAHTAPLAANTVVYYLVPPPAQGDTDARLENWLAQQSGSPARIVYTSTSGVYGDCGGRRVSEDTPAKPATHRAVRRVAAEKAVAQWAAGCSTSWLVLRVAGIYGPDRLPLDSIVRGEPVIRESEAGPGNRIHVDDLVTALLRAGCSTLSNTAVNIADGNDHSGTWFRQQIARLAGLPAPPEISRASARISFSPMRYSFLAESRRLDVTRMLQELKVALAWSDQVAGIRASLPERMLQG